MKELEKIINECKGTYICKVREDIDYCPFLLSYGLCEYAKHINKGLIECCYNYMKKENKEGSETYEQETKEKI